MIRRTVFECGGEFESRSIRPAWTIMNCGPGVAAECDIANIPEALTFHRNLTVKPAHVALDHRALLVEKLMERFGDDRIKRRYLLRERAMHLADLAKQRLKDGSLQEGRELLVRGLSLSLGKAPSLKTGWRCLSRLAKSYLSHNR